MLYYLNYFQPMTIWTKISLGLAGIACLVGLIFLIKYLKRKWLDYQSNKDRSYNVFDKAELDASEIANLQKWNFTVPERLQNVVNSEIIESKNDSEIVVKFN